MDGVGTGIMRLQQSLELPNNPEEWKLLGSDPGLWVLLHDLELPEELRKQRPNSDEQGAPETVKLIVIGNSTTPFTKDLQQAVYLQNPGLLPESFDDIIKTWQPGTDGKIGENNYITNPNYSGELPKLPLDILFGGTIIKVIRESSWIGGFGVPVGTKMLELLALDIDKIPDVLPYKGNEHFIVDLVTVKGDKVNPFVQNGGGKNGGRPCRTIFMKTQSSRIFIEKARARKLESLHLPNPYRPEWVVE
jgi:hypothetical protein